MKPLHLTALVLAIIGALNWGLVGLVDFDVVAAIFGGEDAPLSRVVYSLVGIAGLVLIFTTSATYGSQAESRRRQRHVPS